MLSASVSRSSSQPYPPVRVPRYLRRYTICATQHRPTSPLAHSFTPDDPQWHRRSESFTVNPGPKVHHYTYTTIPSPSPSSLFAPVLSPTASQSFVDVSPPTHHLRSQSSNSSIQSLSPSMTECSFHTAVDHTDNIDPWIEHPLSDSSTAFRSSAIASRPGQSSDDTVVSPSDGIKEEKQDQDDDEEEGEWPAPFLTSITRHDLEQYDKENEKRLKRSFTWGRKDSRKSTDEESHEIGRKTSRKLKKKRPESLLISEEEQTLVPAQPFQPRILSIYTEGEHEEFDPLKDLHTVPDAVDDDAQPVISGNMPQDDEWEDMESSNLHHGYPYREERMPEEDERDTWPDDTTPERIRSRTPQEILQGLDVVHEEEEEDSIKTEDVAAGGPTEQRASYPYINNKGKERQDNDDDEIHEQTIEKPDTLHDVTTEPDLAKVPSDTSPRRKKLSKRRRSRRALDTDSPPPPLPFRNPRSKSKTDMRHYSKKPSMPTLRRPRRTTTTPKTVISSVFRPFTSFALLLGINIGGGVGSSTNRRKRLSRELRTPNALLLGRHFSERHIPRFPSRLDGKRTVDKKIVKYE